MKRLGKAAFASCLSLLLVACATGSGDPGTDTEAGLASWYGKQYQGRPTASGEVFNRKAFTAAHRTLPFGTVVEVERLSTGKKVKVRINDRGPFTEGRIIDLSQAAAKRLDMLNDGLARVRIEVVEWGNQ